MVKTSKTDNIPHKSKQKKNKQKNIKRKQHLAIQLIEESKKYQVKETKQSRENNTCEVVEIPSMDDSVIILSDNETDKNGTKKFTAQKSDTSGTIYSSLGEVLKSFQCLRKARKNTISNKTKRSIVRCLTPIKSYSTTSSGKRLKTNTSCTNSNGKHKVSSNNILNETKDDIVVVWSSINNPSIHKPVLSNTNIEECILDNEINTQCYNLNGDSNNLKCLYSTSKNKNQDHEKMKENDNNLLHNKYNLNLSHCSKSNIPVKLQSQENIKRISARLCAKKSNTPQIQQSSEATEHTAGKLREIVIDGCNVAMAYTHNTTFSEVGLKLVIDYFLSRGHSVKAFVPQHKRSMHHPLLEKLYKEGIVVFTPSRKIGGKNITPYDDRYILEYATLCKGIVISLDQYRDLYMEKPEWRDTIENRLLAPTFVGNYIMFPDDPLGREGPTLEQFLRHDT